ncbi:MAG: FkbM family methyltransferase [Proteobacteria bacterium]|nr:FkbM family methyltransferase [Pseudomonadota bacterium]
MIFTEKLINEDYSKLTLGEWESILISSPHIESIKLFLADLLLHNNRKNKLFKSASRMEAELDRMLIYVGTKSHQELAGIVFGFNNKAKSRVFLLAKFGATLRQVSPKRIRVSEYDLVLGDYGEEYSQIAKATKYKFLYLRVFQLVLRYFCALILKGARFIYPSLSSPQFLVSYDRYGRLFGIVRHYNAIITRFPVLLYSDKESNYFSISGNHRIIAANIFNIEKIQALVINAAAVKNSEIFYPAEEILIAKGRKLIKKISVRLAKVISRFKTRLFKSGATLFQKKIATISFGKHRVRVYIESPLDYIESFWVRGMFYESEERGLLNYIAKRYQGGDFIDIGSNIGNHTLFFTFVCNASKVIAIEPYPSTFQKLQKNLALNEVPRSKVETFNVAVGDRDDFVGMEVVEENNVGTACVSGDGNIKMTTLDKLLVGVEIGCLRLIKIDCEGFNRQVLLGMSKTLERYSPEIFLECETRESLQESEEILAKFGYYRVAWFEVNQTPTYFWTRDWKLADRCEK